MHELDLVPLLERDLPVPRPPQDLAVVLDHDLAIVEAQLRQELRHAPPRGHLASVSVQYDLNRSFVLPHSSNQAA